MPAPRCIVAATDFSDTSREALRVARAYADAIGAHVHLLHVIPDPARLPWSVEAGLALGDLATEWRQQARLALEQARHEAALPPDRTVLTVAMGDPAEEIGAAAASLRADLIVLGTHGHGFVGRLLMGSVAGKVVQHADRPVLIVPHPVLRTSTPELEARASHLVPS
ncbi:MAG TPA: universal stress protein [Vicinamibacterales bacterium]